MKNLQILTRYLTVHSARINTLINDYIKASIFITIYMVSRYELSQICGMDIAS